MAEQSYRHTEDMGEISGFGGGYEKTCQDMLENGVKWLIANADKRDLKGHSYANVYGIMVADSDDAKEMEKAMMSGIDDCTGAMHQSVMSRLFFIAGNGWDAYCAELRKKEDAA